MPMLTSKQGTRDTHAEEERKNQSLRNNEYYGMQEVFDGLYRKSTEGRKFTKLVDIMISRENILLAYRNIKGNSGSNTPGTDGRTIKDLAKLSEDRLVELVRKKFSDYHPKAVRRVNIPKANGKLRPLGIPTIMDRMVQQCIKQVLEPICEAKFYYHSYGFRPTRSAENALARAMQLMQNAHMHYVVDMDITGFFDNVWHAKLIRQMWNMGIQDKKLLCIIKAILKAPIKMPNGDIQFPEKGTPQGGIISPLLANIVLNELDQWIASQWENFPMHTPYKEYRRPNGNKDNSAKYRRLRKVSNLKPMFIVRYADDFQIYCDNRETAVRIMEATKKWLKERLHLDISPEKSKIVNLKQDYANFLGYKLKVWNKGNKWVVTSHMSDKAKERAIVEVRKAILQIADTDEGMKQYMAISRYNALVIGKQDYYRFATNVSEDFNDIEWKTGALLKRRLEKQGLSRELKGSPNKEKASTKTYIETRYGKSKRLRYLRGHPIVPIGYVRKKNPMSRNYKVNVYTEEGRREIHKELGIDITTMLWLMENPVYGKSVQFADNRISLYAGQMGKSAVTGKKLEIGNIHCHHIKPVHKGGTDSYDNLILIEEEIHRLIHATDADTIQAYLAKAELNPYGINKLNKYRTLAGNAKIETVVNRKQK